MKIVYSEEHRRRSARTELYGGQLVPPFECPERLDFILGEAKKRGFGTVVPPRAHGIAPVLAVHDENGDQDLNFSGQRLLEGIGASGVTESTPYPTFAQAAVGPGNVSVQIYYDE